MVEKGLQLRIWSTEDVLCSRSKCQRGERELVNVLVVGKQISKQSESCHRREAEH